MPVSLTFTRNFVYQSPFLGDWDEEETSGNVFTIMNQKEQPLYSSFRNKQTKRLD